MKPSPQHPLQQIELEQQRACEIGDPCAWLCTLATASAAGMPSLRTLRMRQLTRTFVEVQITTTSPKWQQLQENPHYELLIHWPSLQRQYRLRGHYELAPRQDVESAWRKKSDYARGLDLSYEETAQSAGLTEGAPGELERAAHDDATMPENIVGLRLIAESIEAWRGDAEGWPTRELFTLHAGQWHVQSLMP